DHRYRLPGVARGHMVVQGQRVTGECRLRRLSAACAVAPIGQQVDAAMREPPGEVPAVRLDALGVATEVEDRRRSGRIHHPTTQFDTAALQAEVGAGPVAAS